MTTLQSAIKAQRESERSVAIKVPCRLCQARAGERCQDPDSGYVLTKQVAHLPRLRDAGLAPGGGSGG